MKIPSFGRIEIGSAIVLFCVSFFFAVIGVNEFIIGVVTFINANYGVFYGGDPIEVNTSHGIIRGFKSHPMWVSREGREFFEFLGVPFAYPPIGNLRFKPPVPLEKWEGVREARSYGPKCIQFDPFIHVISGSEDCLYLNIFSPEIKTEHHQPKLPVIVFIHGGLFMFGRAELFRPDYIINEDVVLVSIHYRLGPFGFLNMGTEDVRGNMGMKDQVLAMKWVKENIANFGGDPNAVTLMAESAGGASIHLHMLSPQSKGLFHRAVTMSGTALNHWAFNPKPKEQSRIFARRMNCMRNTTTEILSCLQRLDESQIAQVFPDVNDRLHHRLSIFAPTIEPVLDSTTFLHDAPERLIKSRQILNPVPWLNGANSNEGLIYAVSMLRNATCAKKLNEEWNRRAPGLFDYEDYPIEQRNVISQKILAFYMENKTFTLEALQNTVKMFSDSSFYFPLEESAVLHANISESAPMYLYSYAYRSQCALAQFYMNMFGFLPVTLDGLVTNFILLIKNIFGIPVEHHGVCHGDELAMLFQFPKVLCVISKTSPDYKFSKSFVKLWASFARYGKPMTPKGTRGWPKVEVGKPLQYLKIDQKYSIIQNPFNSRLRFWKNLGIYS